MASPNEADFDLRENYLLSRNNLSNHWWRQLAVERHLMIRPSRCGKNRQAVYAAEGDLLKPSASGCARQRLNPDVPTSLKGCRGWLPSSASPKVVTDNLDYSVASRDTAKSRKGCFGNRCLRGLAESILMNMGGSHQDAKLSSPTMFDVRVGGVIVLSGWESQPQGEGRQRVNISPIER